MELGRRDKLNSPPPSPSLSASLPPCLNHHHLYNLSQINYILSHLFQTFLVLKNLILLAVVPMKIILTSTEKGCYQIAVKTKNDASVEVEC